MRLYSSPRALEILWRQQLEMALEAGRTPVLSLGRDSLHPDSLWSLLVMDGLSRRRPGAVDSWVVSGGEGVFWQIGAGLWERGRQGGVLYGGNDGATFAASLTLCETPPSGPGWGTLPAGMAWMLTPTAVLGAEGAEGEYLPFVLAEEDFAPLSAPAPQGDWLGQVEGWSVALLALGILIVALIL